MIRRQELAGECGSQALNPNELGAVLKVLSLLATELEVDAAYELSTVSGSCANLLLSVHVKPQLFCCVFETPCRSRSARSPPKKNEGSAKGYHFIVVRVRPVWQRLGEVSLQPFVHNATPEPSVFPTSFGATNCLRNFRVCLMGTAAVLCTHGVSLTLVNGDYVSQTIIST